MLDVSWYQPMKKMICLTSKCACINLPLNAINETFEPEWLREALRILNHQVRGAFKLLELDLK